MKLNTVQFGEIEVEEHRVVEFTAGIPGFEQLNRFIFLKPDSEVPFSFMQSLEDPATCLIVTDPFIFYPDYICDLSQLIVDELGIVEEKEAMIWTVVTIQGSLEHATLNLLAPIVVNSNLKLGKQIILNGTEYKVKHTLFRDRPETSGTDQEQE